MSSLPFKRPNAHRTFIADLNNQFPSMELTSPPKTDYPITLNYNNTNTFMTKDNPNSEGKSIYDEEGIFDKMTELKNITQQKMKFWPDSVKSFEQANFYSRSITQHNLITECIKNKEKWVMKSNSRDIEDTAMSIFEKKNESESKKSSIYHSEKIDEENEQEDEKQDNDKKFDKKSASKSSFFSKSNRTGNSAKKEKDENGTNNEQSQFSDTEKVNIKEEEINKLITKKNVLVRQKTLRQTYSKNSFFIFSLNSKFRKTLIDIIESKAFQWVLRFFLLLNTIAFMIKYYYSDAQSSQSLEQPSFYIELVCNFYFLVEILLRILTMGLVLESKTFLREPFQIMDFIVTVASFLQYLSIPELKQLGLVVKMMRPFRVFNSFPELRKSIVALLDSLVFISKYLSTLLFLLIFFGILGLHLFKGMNENRCRMSETPINSTYWPADNNLLYLCGYRDCQDNTFCKNPADYGVPVQGGENHFEVLNFGLLDFNNFFTSCLTNLSFLTFVGWGLTTNIFWHTVDPYVFALFSISQIFIVGMIYVNMVLAEFYESFILSKSGQLRKEFRENSNDSKASQIFKSLKTAIENARKNQRRKSFYRRKSSRMQALDLAAIKQLEDNMDNDSNMILFKKDYLIIFDLFIHNRFVKLFFNICTLLNILLLIIDSIWFFDYPEYNLIIYDIDLVFTMLFMIEILFALIHYGPLVYWDKNSLQKFDLIIGAFVSAGFVLEIYNGYIFRNSDFELQPFFVSIKLLRIFKMLVKSKLGFFKSIGRMINELIKSIMETGDYIIIVFVFLLVSSLIGIELMHCDDICQAQETNTVIFQRYNYNSFGESIMSTYLIFINEEWYLFVLDYWNLKGWPYIIYFIVILIVCQLFIMKMFTVLLINHFCRSTNMKYLIKHSDEDKYFLPKFWKRKIRQIYLHLKPHFLNCIKSLLNLATSYFIKEKEKIKTVRQNDNVKKSIMMNKIKTLPTRKSVRIVENRNTINNLDDNKEDFPKFPETPNKKDEIQTTPLDSKRDSGAKAIARFEINMIKKEQFNEIKNGERKIKNPEECFNGILEEDKSNLANSNFQSSEFPEIKNEPNLNMNLEYKLNDSNVGSALNNSNNLENKAGGGILFGSGAIQENKVKTSKTMKSLTKKKSEKNVTQSIMTSPKTNKSISQSNTILQFSSILDSNNDDLRSDLNTAKMIKENKGKSLFLFNAENKFRIYCRKIIKHFLFQLFMLSLVIGSCIMMAFKDPFSPPTSEINTILRNLEIVLFIFFLFEFLIKVVANGFLFNGPDSCLMKTGDQLDFLILILNVYEISHGFSSNFKSLRMLKFFYIGPYRRSLKVVVKTIILCIPNLIKICIITIYVMYFFSFFAVKILKNRLFQCLNVDFSQFNPLTKSDCFDYGGDWVKKDFTYDSIPNALYTLFTIASTEGWIWIAFDAIDARAENELPLENQNKYWNVYYIIYFTVSNLIIFNILIGILVEKYFYVKLKENKFHLLNEEQREWAHIRKSILKMKPMKKKMPPTSFLPRLIFRMSQTKIYRFFFIICNVLNSFLYMLYWHRQEQIFQDYLVSFNFGLTIVFVIELILMLIVKGTRFFATYWHFLDFAIVGFSFSVQIMNMTGFVQMSSTFASFASVTQVFRILKIIGKIEFLKKIFITIKCIMPQASNLLILLIIFMVMYTLIGMELFVYLKPQQTVDGIDIHFRDFFYAFITLLRVVTTDVWFRILADCQRQRQPYFPCNTVTDYEDYAIYGFSSCGSPYAWLYYVSFDIIVVRIVLNLFIAMLLAAAEEIIKIEKSSIGRYQLDKIKELWLEYDPNGSGYISYKDFWKFSSQIAIIFGVDQGDLLNVENRTNFLKILEIPVYENTEERVFCYRFHDVIVKLAKVSIILKFGVTDLEVFGEKKKLERESRFKCFQKKKPNIFKETNYLSGDMAYLCRVLVNFRKWRQSVSPSSNPKRRITNDSPTREGGKMKILDIKSLIERIKFNLKLEQEQEMTFQKEPDEEKNKKGIEEGKKQSDDEISTCQKQVKGEENAMEKLQKNFHEKTNETKEEKNEHTEENNNRKDFKKHKT